jgi:hypothetical protein
MVNTFHQMDRVRLAYSSRMEIGRADAQGETRSEVIVM